ncbi:MAG: aminotransferase class III-fold pyridoxal phosphate-dependent enzyme [Kofleriaceae bacterium]
MTTEFSPAALQARYAVSQRLLARARAVIPNGAWGHSRFPAIYNPDASPWFVAHGRGARFSDVDGHEYIDYMCGYGAMLQGYANPEIDAAAARHLEAGDCFTAPSAMTIEFAETMCRTIQGAAWCAFGKNGSDATTTALLIARAQTSRRHIVCIRGAYNSTHVWAQWCNPGAGRHPDDSATVITVGWNDLGELEEVFARRGDSIAAIMTMPYHAPIGAPAALPTPAFLAAVRRLSHHHGVVWISDDVRMGFRLSLHGSHAYFGYQPDLMCFSKALGNTHPISAVTGVESLRTAAESVFTAGTFWSAGAPMAAAVVNLRLLANQGGIEKMRRLGTRLCEGLTARASHHGLLASLTGMPAMPTMTFADDPTFRRMTQFTRIMNALGSIVSPLHNWFLSTAHTDGDIDTTLEHADRAMAELVRNPDPA